MYKTSAAAIVCIRYRAQYQSSPVTDFLSMAGIDYTVIARIFHVMIDGKKPKLETIEAKISSGKLLVEAISACEKLIASEAIEVKNVKGAKATTKSQFDEYEFLAQYSASGLPGCLLYELPIFGCVKAMIERMEMMQESTSSDVSYRKMNREEVMKILGR